MSLQASACKHDLNVDKAERRGDMPLQVGLDYSVFVFPTMQGIYSSCAGCEYNGWLCACKHDLNVDKAERRGDMPLAWTSGRALILLVLGANIKGVFAGVCMQA